MNGSNSIKSNQSPGPEIEFVYPPETAFSQTDLSTICFNSFPERHDGDIQEDMYFNFTIRNNSPQINLSSPSPPYGSSDQIYGVSVFRQEYDATTKRSFNQKSLVIMSSHEFPVFFMNLLRIIVTGSNLGDITHLEAACAQIEAWAPPRIGKQQLPFLGCVMTLDMSVSSCECDFLYAILTTLLDHYFPPFHYQDGPRHFQLKDRFLVACPQQNPRNLGCHCFNYSLHHRYFTSCMNV